MKKLTYNFPKISIVTPTFNRADFLEETILSVISQNYPNLEYIIVDGGSTDGTVEIIKKYEKHLKCWISEKDDGMYDAIQKGFEISTGEVMAWLNSDDKYHPGSLFIVGEIFNDLNEVTWISGTPSILNESGHCVKTFPLQFWSKERILAGDYKWIQQESTFWRRSLWNKAGSHTSKEYRFASDYDLWLHFLDFASLYSVNTVLAGFRFHENQLSQINSEQYKQEAEMIYQKFFSLHGSMTSRILKFFFHAQLKMKNSKIRLIKSSAHLLYLIMQLMYGHKKIIIYNFISMNWSIK